MGLKAMLRENAAFFLAVLPLFIHLIGLVFAVYMDEHISKKHRAIMLLVIAANFLLIVQNYVEFKLVVGTAHIFLRTCVAIFGYCIRPVILALFIAIVSPKKHIYVWALIGLNAAVSLTALFSRICFWIDAENNYHGGILCRFCLGVSILLLANLLYCTLRRYREKRQREIWLPLLVAALILAACGMDSISNKGNQPVEFLTIAAVSSCVCFYIWLHLQFVREHEQALMAEQRIEIMMTQIQPHFLNNTLSTIQALCRIDPEKAFDTTAKFGTYLRQNIEFLNQPDLIPLEKEIEHTRLYADIERLRFPNITVVYDLGDTEFSLPVLTIQPLVENAIRHGVRIRKSGLVTVRTQAYDDRHEITITDNGKGFDPRTATSGGMHIGIQNVRERIERMCGGTLKIDSKIGEGTTVTIQLPRREEKL